MKLKILNLYAGIGGNRKLWTNCDVTAVEINPQIAKIYRDFFPDDTVIIRDAHEYLLEHYAEFDFIWGSPPCPTHSRMRQLGVTTGHISPVYPDMKLYQEIIFLKKHHKGLWVIENVIPYYEYLIKPSVTLDRHPFWSNFTIAKKKFKSVMPIKNIPGMTIKIRQELLGIDISKYKISGSHGKDRTLKNYVDPLIGQYILAQALQSQTTENAPDMQLALFE